MAGDGNELREEGLKEVYNRLGRRSGSDIVERPLKNTRNSHSKNKKIREPK